MSARPPTTEAPKPKEIPEIVVDPHSKRRYERGRFLGKGGFAKCYELKDMATGEITAGKIVPKSKLKENHQKERISQEILLHKSVAHTHVVKMHSYFQDQNFVYMVLELCRKR